MSWVQVINVLCDLLQEKNMCVQYASLNSSYFYLLGYKVFKDMNHLIC